MQANRGEPAIEAYGLAKTYHPGHPKREIAAVRSLDLRVPKNSIFGFIGPNGAGKTTSLKMLLGLVRPTAGQAKILGHDILNESLALRRRIGYLPQEPRFPEHMTARAIVAFKARFFFAGTDEAIDERVDEMLALTGLSDRADRPVRGFSGGEMQRLGIAQAQVNQPDLLILDEPAAGLDPLGRRDVLAVMKQLRSKTTIFYSTHILDDVEQVSDEVAVMHRGRLIAQAPLPVLLGGRAEKIYTLKLTGDLSAAQSRLAQESWVISIRTSASGEWVSWEVEVTDDEAARDRLLRLVLEDPGVQVTDFGSKRLRLEDVFADLVREDDGG